MRGLGFLVGFRGLGFKKKDLPCGSRYLPIFSGLSHKLQKVKT